MGDVETGWPLPGASAGAEGTGRSGKEELEGEEELAKAACGVSSRASCLFTFAAVTAWRFR